MPVTRPTTKLTPDELLTHLHDALAVLGLGELRRALDDTIAEPSKDESRLAWLWRLVEPQLRRRLESRAERRIRDAPSPPTCCCAPAAAVAAWSPSSWTPLWRERCSRCSGSRAPGDLRACAGPTASRVLVRRRFVARTTADALGRDRSAPTSTQRTLWRRLRVIRCCSSSTPAATRTASSARCSAT
jgi:hypothetical protein